MAGGSTLTSMLVTTISGGFTTDSDSTFPVVLVALAASQQEVEGLLGFLTYHHDESKFLPIISAFRPTFNAPATAYDVPGPKRQLTGWSLGEARIVLGVGVGVMVGGSKVSRVSIGIGVGVEILNVGVSSVGWMEGAGVSVG